MTGELTEWDRSGGAHVLVWELIDHLLELIDRNLGIVLEHMVVNRTSSALDGGVSVEVEVILKWMSDIVLNKSTRIGVLVPVPSHIIPLLREEADVMTLGANSNGPLDLFWS
jgi:hypothetical protein